MRIGGKPLGYHDSDECKLDLWSPVNEECRCPMTDPEADHCAIENRAFSPYAKHSQEVEDVINMAIANFNAGNYSMSFELDDDFSESDLEYIENEIQRRLGFQYLTLIFYKKNVIIYM